MSGAGFKPFGDSSRTDTKSVQDAQGNHAPGIVENAQLPTAIEPFIDFAGMLRANGFSVAPEQTRLFIEAVGLLGPRSMQDIYQSALATLAPPIERRDEFNALYRLVFLGHSLAGGDAGSLDDDDELQAFDERDGSMDTPEADQINEVGEQASASENLSVREFASMTDDTALRQFERLAPARLPRRKTYRRRGARKGDRWDLRRSLRDALKRDGEVLQIPRLVRKTRQRRIVLLIDISGSMKEHTEAYLRFAHALSRSCDRVEVFTLGTRLTRVSRALRIRDREQALATASTLVADWDGGTRLGDALYAFLSIPRFAGFTRGALVLMLSDGLERGDHSSLTQSVERLSRLVWQLVWLTPLANNPGYVPQTDAMVSVLPHLDSLGNGATAAHVCGHLLDLSRSAAV